MVFKFLGMEEKTSLDKKIELKDINSSTEMCMCKGELGFYKINKLLILSNLEDLWSTLWDKVSWKKKIQKFLASMNNSFIITHFYSYIYLFIMKIWWKLISIITVKKRTSRRKQKLLKYLYAFLFRTLPRSIIHAKIFAKTIIVLQVCSECY